MAEDSRMHILKMIEEGKINADDGLKLLNAMGKSPNGQAADNPASGSASTATPRPALATEKSTPPDFKKWRSWWLIPFYIGLGITLMGGGLMYWAYIAFHTFTLWFVLASLPFTLGVVVMALSFASSTAKWIHLRVDRTKAKAQGEDGPRLIAISFPMPFGLLTWFLRTFGDRIPNIRDKGIDVMVPAMLNEITAENPLYLDVDDDDAHVQVYIG